jgi:Na+/H+-dicarboxylate symporter
MSAEEPQRRNMCACFGVLNSHPVAGVLSFAAMGLATGIGLSFWTPEDDAGAVTKETTLKWIGLLGDLFIRALTCVVLPMVFATVAISMVDMVHAGKASAIGWKTIGMYLTTTVIASIIGIISIAIYSPFFQTTAIIGAGPAVVSLGCNSSGSLLTEADDGSISCSTDYTSIESTQFVIEDISGSLMTNSGGVQNDISLSDTIYEGVFMKIITKNIIMSFGEGNFAAVVFFGIVFGIALAVQIAEEAAKYQSGKGESNAPVQVLLNVLKETEAILVRMIMWIITLTPFAVFSLIAAAIGSQTDLAKEFSNVGLLLAATITGFIIHIIIVDIGLLFFFTRENPFTYLKFLIPAQTTAFACASSAATLPVTLKSVKESGVVPEAIAHFVLPLGATINMDGSAIYTPCACIWLAVLNGITPNIGQYILLIILSTIGSAGAAPVPSAGLVLVITAYNTVFNTTGTPLGFSFIVASDWLLDRLVTMLNVTGDSVVARIVTASTPMNESGEITGNEETSSGVPDCSAKEIEVGVDSARESNSEDEVAPNVA